MVAIHLLPLAIRGQKAPYLWVFHKALERLGDRAAYIVSNHYLKDGECADKACVIIPEQEMQDFASGYANYTLAWRDYLTREIPQLTKVYDAALKSLLRERDLHAVVTWCNCPSLEKACQDNHIALVHQELGSLRAPSYLSSVYFDFSGVNGNTEAEARYMKMVAAGPSVPVLTRQELVELFCLENAAEKTREYECGIALQVEDDSNVIAFSNGFDNTVLLSHVLQESKADRVLVRSHPGAYFSFVRQVSDRLIPDDSENSFDFLSRISHLYTVNSSVGVEALLRGISVTCVGDAPFKFVTMEQMGSEEFNRRLSFYCLNYLVPESCLFDAEYLQWRLGNPSEAQIYERHLRLFKRERLNAPRPVRSSLRRGRSLGEELAIANDHIKVLEADGRAKAVHIKALEADGRAKAMRIEALEADGRAKAVHIEALEADGRAKAVHIEALEADGRAKAVHIEALEADGRAKAVHIEALEADGRAKAMRIETLEADGRAKAMRIETLEADGRAKAVYIEALLNSASWRLTRPLRWISAQAGWLVQYVKGG